MKMRQKTRYVSISNQKGGVGKTTTTINLATALAAVGKKVLVVDLDPQGNASTGLGIDRADRTHGTYELLFGECTVEEAAVQSRVPNLSVIPASIHLSGAEIELIDIRRREFRLKEALRGVEDGKGNHTPARASGVPTGEYGLHSLNDMENDGGNNAADGTRGDERSGVAGTQSAVENVAGQAAANDSAGSTANDTAGDTAGAAKNPGGENAVHPAGIYDYVLFDCPPSLNLLTLNALIASDGVLVPLQCEFFALEGLSHLVSTIERVKGSFNPDLALMGVVLTMFDRRNNLCMQVAENVRAHFGDKVYETVIPRNVRISEAPSHGLPAIVYDMKCSGSQAYILLAREILKRARREEQKRAA
ncbi:MAG: AAA family ATPase [Alphaproteobacteria bacterium]|nr:AAA family ATPase [Alphaproteobacteria bacterium]MDE2337099.1 AAA family ATPase [Alphaproteobacteria bacterium]